ncbi:MAG: N-acetyl-gamma-glutamyl-phosphate reductase [Candidatus Delongbacteria bacterium]|nr:N-acetyl-gamma-glutamyl-phosphate reductase [Candidatus Delongbacteria bacterium]
MIKIAIVGGSGYSGKELIRLLLRHPSAEIVSIFAKTTAGKKISDLYPVFRGRIDLEIQNFDVSRLDSADLVFLALPHGESMSVIPHLMVAGKKVIDLSGDFRFPDVRIYEQWYGLPHRAEEWLPRFVYGLPELFRSEINGAAAIANPGCYPTASILGLAPILSLTDQVNQPMIVNALSGVSGAGRKAALDFSYCEVNESIRAYRIGSHQHTPEIAYYLEKHSGRSAQVVFVPHLVPMSRGIYTTIYVRFRSDFDLDAVRAHYARFYADSPFVRLSENPPEIQNVVYTNVCDIGISADQTHDCLIVNTAIDNLVKGAAGQAIQNMNLMYHLKEEEGLL